MSRLQAIIVDIDGTLANISHRRHLAENKDWGMFFKNMNTDTVNPWCNQIIKRFKKDHHILLVTGRGEEYEVATKLWLRKWGVSYDQIFFRPKKDNRNDSIIKKEIYDNEIKDLYDVTFAIDDRQRIVDMWRSIGITCLQCAKGDF